MAYSFDFRQSALELTPTRTVLVSDAGPTTLFYVNGTGLTYDANGLINGGTITSIELVNASTPTLVVEQRTILTGGFSGATLYTNVLAPALSLSNAIAPWNLPAFNEAGNFIITTTSITIPLLDGTRLVINGTGLNPDINLGTVTSIQHLPAVGTTPLNQLSGISVPIGVVGMQFGPSDYPHLFVMTGATTVTNLVANNTYNGGYMDGGLGNDTYNGLAGSLSDGVDFAFHATSGVVVNLTAGTATGGGGNDTLNGIENVIGSIFSDLITGNSDGNALGGDLGDDTINGLGGADFLFGGDGNDTLDGGTGADVLRGELGNDTLIIDDVLDFVSELVNQGTDTLSSANLSLDLNVAQYDNIENIKLLGALNLNATGDALDNRLEGNSGINTLLGGSGADTLVGNAGGDIMDGGAGIDTYIGGLGDDAYYVRNLGANGRVEDIFTELANQGTDGITTTVTLNINEARYVNIENVYMTGTAAIIVGGSSVSNVIIGNDAANGLYGLGSRDIMRGGGGVDTFFYLNASDSGATATTRDLIQDFTVGVDKINLSAVDANGAGAGNGTFVFLTTQGAAFTGVAGQLRFRFEDNVNNALDKTIVEGDTNGDSVADFTIEMSAFGANPGLKALTATDFIL